MTARDLAHRLERIEAAGACSMTPLPLLLDGAPMSYHCGLDHGVASLLGLAPRSARYTCDDCGRSVSCYRNGLPTAWMRAGKPPPRWKQVGNYDDNTRQHFCDTCKQRSRNKP